MRKKETITTHMPGVKESTFKIQQVKKKKKQ